MRVVENMRSYWNMHIGTVPRIIIGLRVSVSKAFLKSRMADERYAARDACRVDGACGWVGMHQCIRDGGPRPEGKTISVGADPTGRSHCWKTATAGGRRTTGYLESRT